MRSTMILVQQMPVHTGEQLLALALYSIIANNSFISSNLLNKADPRVDSDRDNRNNPASSTGGYGQTQQTHGTGMTGGTGGAGFGTTGPASTHGVGATGGNLKDGSTTAEGLPSTQKSVHDNTTLNKLDPRVKVDKAGNPTH